MKSFKTLRLTNSSISTHLTYDSKSNSILLSGQSLSIVSNTISKDIKFLKPKDLESNKRGFIDLQQSYLCFAPSQDSGAFINHSGLSLNYTESSSKYKKFALNQSYNSGIHYFEAICPISCLGIAFGVENAEGLNVVLKLRTTTPRVVGVLIDIEHYIFSLYTDEQLKNPVKKGMLSPGTWMPFIKVKNKGSKEKVVTLNPFCSRCSVDIADERYLGMSDYTDKKYLNVVAVMDLPENVMADDIKSLEENVGLESKSKIKQWVISKEKTNKQTRIAIIQFESKEDKEIGIQAMTSKGRAIEYDQKLWTRIKKTWNKEKINSRESIGVIYKRKKRPELKAPETKVNTNESKPDTKISEPKIEDMKLPEMKTEIKISEASKVEVSKSEEKPKTEEKSLESKEELNKLQYKQQIKSLFKLCLIELDGKIVKQYKEAVSNLLHGLTVKKSLPEFELSKDEKTLAFYLPNTDNLLIVKGSLMKLVNKAYGRLTIPVTSFYNLPETADSFIGLMLRKEEAFFLLKNMKWRALGEYMQGIDSNSVYNFLYALSISINENKELEDEIIIPTKYIDAKISVDTAMKAICLERLYREGMNSDNKTNKSTRIFMLSSNETLEYLTVIFCKIEEALWSMTQNSKASSSLKALWAQTPPKLQTAYLRLLSFQSRQNRLPNELALAEAGLIQKENSQIIHFEDLSTQLEQTIHELPNKTNIEQLWKELGNQLPDSNLLSGKISTNVPLYWTLNNLPAISISSEMTYIQKSSEHPLLLVACQDGITEIYNTKLQLSLLLSSNLKLSCEDIWKTQDTGQKAIDDLGISESISCSQVDEAFEVEELYGHSLFFSEQTIRTNSPISIAVIVKSKEKYYIRIREYSYSTEFIQRVLKKTGNSYTSTLDNSISHLKDKAGVLTHIWDYLINKGYTIHNNDKGLFQLVYGNNYVLENIIPLAFYGKIIENKNCIFNVIYKNERNEIMINEYVLKNAIFTLVNTKSLSIVCNELRIQLSDEFILIAHDDTANVYTKDNLTQVFEYKGRLDTVSLQDQTILIREDSNVSIHVLNKGNNTLKKDTSESLETLDRDIRQEELTLMDMAAYGNTEGNIAINAEGKENNCSVLSKTLLIEGGGEIKNTWNVLSKQECEFDLEIEEEKNVEYLELQLRFSKDGLTSEEIDKVNKVIIIAEKKSEMEKKKQTGDESHLPLTIVWNKGAICNDSTSLANILSYDKKEFKSNYPQPEFIFSHRHNKSFFIKKCIIKSSISSSGNAFPIGSGLIFISNRLSDFKNTPYDFKTDSEYNSWLEKRRQCKVELQSFEPAGFFQMGDSEELIFTLSVERLCKYLYVKPTAFRTKPFEMGRFSNCPLSIEYFGVIGSTYEPTATSSESWGNCMSITEAKIDTKYSIEIQSFTDQWRTLKTISDLKLQGLEFKNKIVKSQVDDEFAKQRQYGLCNLVYDEKELHKTLTRRYRFKVIPGNTWNLSTISVVIYSNKKVERHNGLFKNIEASYLWKCFNEPELFNRVNRALCELVCNKERECEDRIRAMTILNKIIEISTEQANLVRKNIHFEKFIKANVYQSQSESLGLKFLRQFQQSPEYEIELRNFAIKEITNIPKIILHPSTIIGLKSILALVIPKSPELFLQQLIGKLYDVCANYLETALSREQVFLRTRLEINSYSLSPIAWTVPTQSQAIETITPTHSIEKRMPASIKFGYIYTQTSGQFIIDCGKIHELKTVIIYFKEDTMNLQFRFNVTIHGIINDKRFLLYDKEYPSLVWEQLTSVYSIEESKVDKEHQQNSLVMKFGCFIGRYLIIDIEFKNTHTSAIGKSKELEDYLKDGLIAEAYGVVKDSSSVSITEFDDLLNVEEQRKSIKKLGHSATYELIQNSNTFVDLFKLKGGIETTTSPVPVKKKSTEGNLLELQSKLKDEIRKYKEGKLLKTEILNTIRKIESLQRVQCSSEDLVDGSKCVEYLVQICLELVNVITGVIGNNVELDALKKETTCSIVILIKSLFRNFVVYNVGPPREEILQFIKNVLLKEISETEWVQLFIEIVEDYLGQPQVDYSQTSVMNSLEYFNLPEGELLSHLAKRLKLPEQKDMTFSKDIQEPKNTFPLLAASLALTIRSLRKQPVEDTNTIVHHGITCNYCGGKRPIVGIRYKCGHCLNFNVCSDINCMKKHEDEFKDHVLIIIPKPLPYGPSKAPEALKKVLLPSMKLSYGNKIHTGIECDNCGTKNFEGIRYLCGNCDYFNLCEKCYTQGGYVHKKTHVFLRLPVPLIQAETATPKTLIQHLDPDLYPLKSLQPPQKTKKSKVQKENELPLMKRSLSVLGKQLDDYEKLDIDQILQIAYRICIWICHSKIMDEKKMTTVLKLCLELLSILLKLSTVESIRNIFQEDGLDVVITTCLRISGDKELRKGLVKLIYGLKELNVKVCTASEIEDMLREERRDYLEKAEKTIDIRVYLSSCLHQILKSLIESIPKTQAAAPTNLEDLILLLDAYIAILDSISLTKEMLKKYKVVKDEEEELVLPELSRSLSTPISKKEKLIETVKARPLLQFALGLVALLEQLQPSIVGPMYGRVWEIVLKILANINIKQIIEAKLLERLMTLFFSTTIQIQETIYRQLLNISSKMIQFSNMSSLIIKLICSTIEASINTQKEEMAFYLCRGWLDALIIANFSKVEDKSIELKKDVTFVCVEPMDALELLCSTSSLLQKYLNTGSYHNTMSGKYRLIYRSILADKMTQIIVNAKGINKEKLVVEELIKTCNSPRLSNALSNLLYWLFLNYMKDDSVSELATRVSLISKRVNTIFEYIHINESLSKYLLRDLKDTVSTADIIINKRLTSGELQSLLAIEINARINKVVKKLLRNIMKSTTVATYFMFNLNGFDFLFKRLGITDSSIVEKEIDVVELEGDLMKGIDSIITNPRETQEITQITEIKDKNFNPNLTRKDDHAKNMTLIECTGEQNLVSSSSTNWCSGKGGQRLKVYTKQFKGMSTDEISMTFELKKVIEIREVVLSFINFWGMDNYEHMDISSVIMEIGMNKGSYTYFCTLEKVVDNSLMLQGLTIFSVSIDTYDEAESKGNQISEKLNSLRNAKAKYVRFIIRTGVKVAFSGTQASLSKEEKAIGVNYFSVVGYDLTETSQVQSYINLKNQKVAYKLLSVFQQKNLRCCLKDLANSPPIIDQLKTNFNALVSLMDPGKFTIEPFLITLCSQNAELGRWILNELINSTQAKTSGIFMLQMCISNLDKFSENQNSILSFILNELRQEKISGQKMLLDFIAHYMLLLQLTSPALKDPITLNTTKEDLLLVIRKIFQYWDVNEMKENLIKLFLILLRPPKNILSKVNAIEFVLDNLLPSKDSRSLFLASFSSVHSNELGQKLFVKLPEELNCESKEALNDNLVILLNLILNSELTKVMLDKKLALSIYERLKSSQDKLDLVSFITKEQMSLVEELMKKGTIGYLDNEIQLAETIIRDLIAIKDAKKNSMLTELILSLVRIENTVPVCLYILDPEREQWKPLMADNTLKKVKGHSFFLDTGLLRSNQKDKLQSTLKGRFEFESEFNFLAESNWEIIFKEQNPPQQGAIEKSRKLFDALSGRGPFIIFVTGMSEGKHIIIGGFNTIAFPEIPETGHSSKQYDIKSSSETLFFYYSEEELMHFELKKKTDSFGQINVDYSNCASLILSNYFLCMSYSQSYSNTIGGISSLKCIDGKTTYLPYMLSIENIEIWAAVSESQPMTASSDKIAIAPITRVSVREHSWYHNKSPYNVFRSNAVFHVPSNVKIKELGECVVGKSNLKLNLRGIGEDINDNEEVGKLYSEGRQSLAEDILDIQVEIKEDAKEIITGVGYSPITPILNHFEKLNGYIHLIEVAMTCLDKWKNNKLVELFRKCLTELMQFNNLPKFLKLSMSSVKIKELIFAIMAGTPDTDTTGKSKKEIEANEKKWDERCNEMVTHCYSLVSELFEDFDDWELRENAFKTNVIALILDRLAQLTGEGSRKWQDQPSEKPEIEVKDKSKQKEVKDTNKKGRKGVGYSTQIGQIWDVDGYIKSKKAKNSRISALITIIINFVSCDKWEPNDAFIKSICESSLLPLLEANMASSSLLEMAKEHELVTIYLKLFEKFCNKDKLVSLLLELDLHYVPKQRDPIYKILRNLNNLSDIFLKCLKKESDMKQENAVPRKLAEQIQKCHKQVTESVDKLRKVTEGVTMKNILSLPLPQAYKALLRNLRFGYTNMRDSKGQYKHFYHSHADQEKTAAQPKLVRLAQELADLSNALPDEHTNAIYIRVDEERIDFMKALVMGASGTPYGHGAFEYDIYCPSKYPNESPKMNLTTTGNGAVRFNPNLYNDGKVCLSLLGTWRGTATENWDPVFSTILQVLMSIQAIVMSEEVFFNEPGFEGQIGQVEGEKKNEGYSNIVRYCNIKFAMIGQIKNPPKGFESVIKRHFYIKKAEIMKEVNKWIEYADTKEASYNDLVASHNSSWCKKFKQGKTRYKEMLVEAVKELEQTLNSIQPPKELIEEAGGDPTKVIFQEKEVLAFTESKPIEGVDIEEDTAEEQAKKLAEKENKLNIDDAGVKDRWSRYIGAVGVDAVAKQSKSSVFLSGAGGLGIEIAKNIILSGCKEFVIHDTELTSMRDLSSQFFLSEKDIGKNRAIASVARLQQLNYYVKVIARTESLSSEKDIETIGLDKFTVVILTDVDYKTQIAIDEYCRKHKISLVIADVKGMLCKIVNDFGDKYEILDADGEEIKECMIKEISNEENGLVTTIQGQRHGFSEGDTIIIKEVEGMILAGEISMDKNTSINDTIHIVKCIDPFNFRIGDTRKFTKYTRNGIAKQLKVIKEVSFKRLTEVYTNETILYEPNLLDLDFVKTDDLFVTHATFQAIDSFKQNHNQLPQEWNPKDAQTLLDLVKDIYHKHNKTMSKVEEEFVRKASYTVKVAFSPLCTFIGGLAAQEAIKAITGKYSPINQIMYYNAQELIPNIEVKDIDNAKSILGIDKEDRYIGIKTLIGEKEFKKLANWKLFMVGVGAIGCELLKNYAMLGIGSEDGKVLITDPDVIETSNLNRQFLFKEKHLRKPKSTTAAAIVTQMNPTLKGKIFARIDRVDEKTSNIFTDNFFNELNVVTNALDNVQARRYIDSRCVINRVPLLESGTLGGKGHVQVILPFKTESYSSQNDPEESLDIPVCTLKMFPEEAVHCIEWARDKFEKLFTQKPKSLQKFIGNTDFIPQTSQDIRSLEKALKWLNKKPGNFKDCVKYARSKFQKYFVNDIKQLLFVYPLDAKGKEGQLFWTLPKRPPHEFKFDPDNKLHADYVIAVASLFARTWSIPVPEDIRTEEGKKGYAKMASEISIADYIPNAKKAKEITSEVEDIKEEKMQEDKVIEETSISKLVDAMEEKLVELAADGLCIIPEDFEKDNDINFHIDFIYAMTNCRAECYGIEKVTWITTKMKAGRIVPALATTTAVVAGLQTLELVRLVQGSSVKGHRNAFVNLALPYISLSQPGPPKQVQLTKDLCVTLWDRWDIKLSKGVNTTLGEMLETLRTEYKLEPRDVLKRNKPIWMHSAMNPDKVKERESLMSSQIKDVLELMGNEAYVDLTVTFSLPGDEKLLSGVPVVRLVFK